jgi:hypothetical protein
MPDVITGPVMVEQIIELTEETGALTGYFVPIQKTKNVKAKRYSLSAIAALSDHNLLAGLQGGDGTNYYHLEEAAVTQVVEAFGNLPTVGSANVLYYVKANNKQYYWNGSTYIPIGSSGGSGGSLTNNITELGGWDAATNTLPTIASGVGNAGDFAIVGVAGTTIIDGISSWGIGDYIWYDDTTSVWRKIDNQEVENTVGRPTLVFANETEFEQAYNQASSVGGGILEASGNVYFTKNHSFNHQDITINGNGNRIYFNGFTLSVNSKNCQYNNFIFDNVGETPITPFNFIYTSSGSLNYYFKDCRFNGFLQGSDRVIWNFGSTVVGYVHLYLTRCFVSDTVTISNRAALMGVHGNNQGADIKILHNTAFDIPTQTSIFGFSGTKPHDLDFIYDTSCVEGGTLTPDIVYNILDTPAPSSGSVWTEYPLVSRTDNDTLVISADGYADNDFTGKGVCITSNSGATIQYYRICYSIYTGTNENSISVRGEGNLPATIEKVEICEQSNFKVISRGYVAANVQATCEDIMCDLFETTNKTGINLPIASEYEHMILVEVDFLTNGAATTTDFVVNFRTATFINRVNQSSDLLTSPLTVNDYFVTTGLLINPSYSNISQSYLRTRITTAGSGAKDGKINYYFICQPVQRPY